MKRFVYSAKFFLPQEVTFKVIHRVNFTRKGQPYIVYTGNDGRKCCRFLSRALLAKRGTENMVYWESDIANGAEVFNTKSRRTYRVSPGCCSCPDYRYKSNRYENYKCKHVKGLRQLVASNKINLKKPKKQDIDNKTYGTIRSYQKDDSKMNVYVTGSPSTHYSVTYFDGTCDVFLHPAQILTVLGQLLNYGYEIYFLTDEGKKVKIEKLSMELFAKPESKSYEPPCTEHEEKLYDLVTNHKDSDYDSTLAIVNEQTQAEELKMTNMKKHWRLKLTAA